MASCARPTHRPSARNFASCRITPASPPQCTTSITCSTGGRLSTSGGRYEVGEQRQKAESRRQKAESRRQKAEGRKQKAEGRSRNFVFLLPAAFCLLPWSVR